MSKIFCEQSLPLFSIFFKPIENSIDQIDLVGVFYYSMILMGVNVQFGLCSKMFESGVKLISLGNGDMQILLSMNNEELLSKPRDLTPTYLRTVHEPLDSYSSRYPVLRKKDLCSITINPPAIVAVSRS